MAKGNKFNIDLGMGTGVDELAAPIAPARFERNERRGPGRPIGKRSNPAFKQYTVLLRRDTHDRAIAELQKRTAKPDFGEYVERLIAEDLARKR